jgi:hypothetical protein
MRYKIKVKSKKYWGQAEIAQVHRAARWAIKKLDIAISPIPVVIKLCGPSTIYGDCLDLDHKIVIRLFSSTEWVSTLFHELVHAKQYLYGELQLEHSHAYWKGKLVNRDDYEYSNEPWEIEASTLETKMAKKFLDI